MTPEMTQAYILQQVRQRPGITHSKLLGSDREGADRRRTAIAILLCRGEIVRTHKPHRYTLKEPTNA